jgi:hypothetical protein
MNVMSTRRWCLWHVEVTIKQPDLTKRTGKYLIDTRFQGGLCQIGDSPVALEASAVGVTGPLKLFVVGISLCDGSYEGDDHCDIDGEGFWGHCVTIKRAHSTLKSHCRKSGSGWRGDVPPLCSGDEFVWFSGCERITHRVTLVVSG